MSNQQPKMNVAQAFNIVAPAARSCQATGEQHDMIVAALLSLKELVEATVAAEAEQQKSAPTLKAVEATTEKAPKAKKSKPEEASIN